MFWVCKFISMNVGEGFSFNLGYVGEGGLFLVFLKLEEYVVFM